MLYPLLGWHDNTETKATPPGVAFHPVPMTPVLKVLSNALAPIVPVAVKTTLWDGQMVVLFADKSMVQPEVVFINVETVPTQPVDWDALEFVNLKVSAPVALLAQKIPGFSSAWTTPP